MDSKQKNAVNENRRDFMKQAMLAAFAVPAVQAFQGILGSVAYAKDNKAPALPAGAEMVSESDPVASAIGFRHDITKVDYAKYPQRKKPEAKNQFCKSCALYTSVNEGWGKCSMLTKGLVSANGWCGSYNKKS